MIKICDICGGKYDYFIPFGNQPIVNDYNDRQKNKYKNTIAFCKKDKVFKNLHGIRNKKLFNENYPYYSSLSKNFAIYLKKLSKQIAKELKLNSNKKILEIGSSDGTFLEYYKKNNYVHYGLEPTKLPHKIAKKKGIKSLNIYFNKSACNDFTKKGIYFDLIFSINTIAHIDKINKSFLLISSILSYDGCFVFENISFDSVVNNLYFDQLYDEHVYTISPKTVYNLCKLNNLHLIKIIKTSTQGGSYRYYISKNKKVPFFLKSKYLSLNKLTKQISLTEIHKFHKKIKNIKISYIELINSQKKHNTKIYGFGASAKTVFLINFLDLDRNTISCIYDNSIKKINKNLPGTDIVVKNENSIKKIKNGIMFVFAWNHYKEILNKHFTKKNKIKWIKVNFKNVNINKKI